MKKLMFAVALFALTAFAASNVFHVTIDDTVWIGATQVKAANYKIEVDNGKATLKSGKTVIETPAKLETADHKYSQTAMVLDTVNGNKTLKAIEIGGSTQRIVFEGGQIPTE